MKVTFYSILSASFNCRKQNNRSRFAIL